MTLAGLVGADGLLAVGKHRTSLDELEDVFVRKAPFPEERKLIFDALSVWLRQIAAILPKHRYWIDGSFVTYKTSAPPNDVDVVVLVRAAELNMLDQADRDQLGRLFTQHNNGSRRVQPMNGLVDAFVAFREDADSAAYWHRLWSAVRDDSDGGTSDNVQKGYVEVMV